MTFNVGLIIFILAISCSNSSELRNQEVNKSIVSSNNFEYISSLKLPDKLEWCGEAIPLEIPEVRERAEREFYLLLQQPGQIVLYIKRSAKYFPIFEKIIGENNLPDDLKYLSVAESALYMSRSHAGALGLWQFMPGTARKMGLHISEYVDERLHPEKSTAAAMTTVQSTELVPFRLFRATVTG